MSLAAALFGRMRFSDGRLEVRPTSGPINLPSNREIVALAKPTDPTLLADVDAVMQRATWTSFHNITELTITAHGDDAANRSNVGGVFVSFNEIVEATPSAPGLVEGTDLIQETFRRFVPYNVPRTFNFDAYLKSACLITSVDSVPNTSLVILEGA